MPVKRPKKKRSLANQPSFVFDPIPTDRPGAGLVEFISRWQNSTLSERASAQSHFIDLCTVVGQQPPTAVDVDGNNYTFEKGVTKTSGGGGFADVWMRDHFAWEYKARNKDLSTAYQQLLQYREALDNPPLLVVCGFDRFEVHTNWTNTPPEIYRFNLQDLLHNQSTPTCKLPPLEVLRALFEDPEKLRPGITTAEVTEQAAVEFAKLAASLRKRGVPADRAAHFLMRLLFCLFSQDIGLLPNRVFSRLLKSKPAEFLKKVRALFVAMASGGTFGAEDIPYFDGGLFMDDEAYELSIDDMGILSRAADLNWAGIEPAIFGTLFERILDPDKRELGIGARYTSTDDIELIIEPVLMAPLRKRWIEVQQQATAIIDRANTQNRVGKVKSQKILDDLLKGFAAELGSVRVLDPACGSGNFLYVALKRLLDLEKHVNVFAMNHGLTGFFIQSSPEQLYGIERNNYAHEVTSVAVWIGYLQWKRHSGLPIGNQPIMRPLQNVRCMDAVLERDKEGRPIEPQWPVVDVIIGNPPFLGDKKMRSELSDRYVDDLRSCYFARVPGGADYVTYWFERACTEIALGRAKRAGLLATNSIRMVGNRKILERVKAAGDIFMAWSDRPWVLEGANVRVSLVGFDNGSEHTRTLDGKAVSSINADLTAGEDIASAAPLQENIGLCFLGMMKGGPFDINSTTAKEMISAPLNPNGKPNSEVVKPRLGGMDVVRGHQDSWIIDFREMDMKEAALFQAPFEYVRKHVKPLRDRTRDASMRSRWWLHGRSRPALRLALSGLKRCIVTPEVSKHRVFVWMDTAIVPDHKLHVIAREDDYFLGVLQSRAHSLWAHRLGSTLEDRPSYNSETVFSTFPFPWPPGNEPKRDLRVRKIAAAARELTRKRNIWLNPPATLTTQASKTKTLTGLYNERPTWLEDAHRELDEAVFQAYGFQENMSDEGSLACLLQLNKERYVAEQAQALLNRKPPAGESGSSARKIPTSVRLSRRREIRSKGGM